jgi:hypothetical protein
VLWHDDLHARTLAGNGDDPVLATHKRSPLFHDSPALSGLSVGLGAKAFLLEAVLVVNRHVEDTVTR